MRRKIFTLAFLFAAFGALSVPAFARTDQLVKANIPFPFIVESTQMPAGHYTFERLQTNPGVLLIRNANGSREMVLLTEQAEARGEGNNTNLVFDKVGGRYFLSQIWTVGSNWGLEIPEAGAERHVTS
jgi:hypothetical protein